MPAAATLEHPPVDTRRIDRPRGAWVIYDEHLPGIAGRYVARKFFIGQVFCFDADEELRAETVSELRAILPPGLVNVGRDKGDFHRVMETWV